MGGPLNHQVEAINNQATLYLLPSVWSAEPDMIKQKQLDGGNQVMRLLGKLLLLLGIFGLMKIPAWSQTADTTPRYRIYNADGKPATLNDIAAVWDNYAVVCVNISASLSA